MQVHLAEWGNSLAVRLPKNVLEAARLRVGDSIVAMDGREGEYDASIERIDKGSVFLTLSERRACPEPHTKITLFQGLPKGSKLDVVVQKCVEVGVTTVAPFMSGRCVAQTEKSVRLNRIAYEAAKQSHRGAIPTVEGALSWQELCARIEKFPLAVVLWEDEHGRTLKQVLKQNAPCKELALIVGPEGGFSAEEIGRLAEAGALSASLGPRVLRTETAGAVAGALVLYEWEMA